MSRRLDLAFARAAKARRAAFILYITAGDPTLRQTLALVAALERAGADIVELGVPFTDPIADGPTNQRAAERALAQGTTLAGVLQLVRQLRCDSQVPVVLFTYYNPVHAYGLARLAIDAAGAGIDAVLFTDVPVEEAQPAWESLKRVGVDRTGEFIQKESVVWILKAILMSGSLSLSLWAFFSSAWVLASGLLEKCPMQQITSLPDAGCRSTSSLHQSWRPGLPPRL